MPKAIQLHQTGRMVDHSIKCLCKTMAMKLHHLCPLQEEKLSLLTVKKSPNSKHDLNYKKSCSLLTSPSPTPKSLSFSKSSLPMAHSLQASLLALLVIFNVLLGQVIAAREVPNDSKKVDKKQPEWFIEPDGSVLIPGVGRVMVPGYGSYTPYDGSTPSGSTGSYGSPDGSTGSYGSTGGTGSYIPGGDDTFVPNPGVEVPNPAGGGGVPAAARP